MGVGHVKGRAAVFLDRDGVLNESYAGPDGLPRPPSSLAEYVLTPGAIDACEQLRALGYLLIVVTNQPDVARGTQRREVVETIHERLRRDLPLDDIRVCYHDDADACACRKPKPGLLVEAARDWGIDLASSFMIGDRWRDVEAGHGAECTTILVGSDPVGPVRREPTARVESLVSATHWICDRSGNGMRRER